jgi:hypothetical protein
MSIRKNSLLKIDDDIQAPSKRRNSVVDHIITQPFTPITPAVLINNPKPKLSLKKIEVVQDYAD